jgi:hypothetical protein
MINFSQKRARAAVASDQLTMALVKLAARGRRPRCGEPADHGLWLSEDLAERELAARLCAGCPVLAECGAAAEASGERFGVWGGRDRSAGKRPAVDDAATAPQPDTAAAPQPLASAYDLVAALAAGDPRAAAAALPTTSTLHVATAAVVLAAVGAPAADLQRLLELLAMQAQVDAIDTGAAS